MERFSSSFSCSRASSLLPESRTTLRTQKLFAFEMVQICKWAFLELLCSRSSGVSYQENLHWERYQSLGSIEGKFNIQTKAVLPSLSILSPRGETINDLHMLMTQIKDKRPLKGCGYHADLSVVQGFSPALLLLQMNSIKLHNQK